MNRRTFGLTVRLLAVLVAIYAFFYLRSQVANQPTSRGPIPVKVVTVCGWLTVEKPPLPTIETVQIDQTPSLRQAIEQPGEKIAVRDSAECDSLTKLNGSVFTTNKGPFKIIFMKN